MQRSTHQPGAHDTPLLHQRSYYVESCEPIAARPDGEHRGLGILRLHGDYPVKHPRGTALRRLKIGPQTLGAKT